MVLFLPTRGTSYRTLVLSATSTPPFLNMADVRAILLIALWVISWPIAKLFNVIVFLLSPIWRVGTFLLLPFIHIGHTIINIITVPFSVQWLERIEVIMHQHGQFHVH